MGAFTFKTEILIVFILLIRYICVPALRVNKNRGPCPNITLQNGAVRYQRHGLHALYTCQPSYYLNGEPYTVCYRRQWSNTFPKCVKPSCPAPSLPPNLYVYQSYHGAVLTFFCGHYTRLHGPKSIYCDGRHWSDSLPTCLNSSVAVPPTACDFETTNDLCGWTHDTNHDFEWQRMNRMTDSGVLDTGPKYDHSRGRGADGYYMYIESSARQTNETARLVSPIYAANAIGVCFEFWYHMYGREIGELRVYLKRIEEGWALLDVGRAIFRKIGNHGDEWLRAFVNIGPVNSQYQIIVEGVRGASFRSDIAIDDFRLIENCTSDDMTTTEETSVSTTDAGYFMESCFNRCDVIEEIDIINMTLTCDCDDSCYFRSRCCVDYFDLCVGGGATNEAWTTTHVATTQTMTFRPKTTETSPTTTKTMPTTIKATPTTMKTTPTTMRMKTTPTVIKSTAMTTPLVRMTTAPIEMTSKTKTTRFIDDLSNDIANMPNSMENKEDIDNNVPVNSKIFNREETTPSSALGNAQIAIYGSSIGFVLIAIIFATIVIVKRCKRNGFRSGNNGDSQSDVRFLTHDEAIDFSLQYGDDDVL